MGMFKISQIIHKKPQTEILYDWLMDEPRVDIFSIADIFKCDSYSEDILFISGGRK
jgi:hypothetical protein